VSQPLVVQSTESGAEYVRRTTENVRVTLTADSAAIASVDSAAVTIAAGSSGNESARMQIHAPGRPSFTASDARTVFQKYLPYTDVGNISPARISPETPRYRVGIGQRLWYYQNVDFTVPENVVLTTVGTGGHTGLTGARTDTLFAGNYYLYASAVGLTTGTDTVVTSAPGFRSANLLFHVSEGTFFVESPPAAMKVGDVVSLTIGLRTPDGSAAEAATNTTLTLAATNASWWNGASAITSGVVTTGQSYFNTSLKATAAGTATFTISAPGYVTKSFTVQVLP
jgi:hypothetical protein